MKVLVAIACGLAALATVSAETVRVARDATIMYNGMMCNDDTVRCDSIPRGLDTNLVSFRGNRDYERVLLGFDLPATTPKKCILRVPKPQDDSEYKLMVVVTDNNWEEATVCGANKANEGQEIGSVDSPGTTVDVSEACRNAKDQKLSLFVTTESSMVTFSSLQSGSNDVFELEYEL
ncbi:hypothetical protein LPJ61_005462 [Coemansia biformis]|uniref:Ubiquitin 3 binding protein But2 C-terminal domain-containing protein n=1 Tax=Coemansia biformis TaxID=1286918 RepID=A0A9W7Y7C9_9FUNG|nr:hypothetical protein LPJ61_005462 [Coemansia biformis]